MMVGNNDRMQGIISQLEEACRAIEVSVQLLQRLAAHSRSKHSLCAHTNAPALTCTDAHNRRNVSLSPPLSLLLSVSEM